MRKLIALIALATAVFSAPGFGAKLPRKAPEFVFQMVDGPQQLLSQYKGKDVVLAFMYTTCPHCKKTAQVLAQVQKEYEGKGVQVLGAVFDKGASGRVQEFTKTLGLNFPVGYSEQHAVLEFLGLPVNDPYFVPILVFIDKTGAIRSQYVGDEKFLSNQEVNIRAEIDKMQRGGTPTTGISGKKTPKS